MEKVTAELLRAWVDGELSPERSATLGTLVAADEKLAAQAAHFEASKLPYKAALNHEIPPVPEDLQAQVAQWSQIASVHGVSSQQQGADAALTAELGTYQSKWKRPYQMALAASLLFLMLSWGGMLLYKPTDAVADWAEAIVNYQNFYVAETVAHSSGDRQAAAAKLTQLKQDYPAFPTAPPELTALGYEFKRVQRLDFANQPVLQMVFLKAGKRPLAICLMPDEEKLADKFTQHALLNSYVWQSNGLRAIVVAEENAAQLKAIAELVRSLSLKVQGETHGHSAGNIDTAGKLG